MSERGAPRREEPQPRALPEDDGSRPVRLAVILEESLTGGGGHQQAINAAKAVLRIDPSLCRPVFFSTLQENIPVLKQWGIHAEHLDFSFVRKALLWLRSRLDLHMSVRALQRLVGMNVLDKAWTKHGIDLVYFTSPSNLAMFTEKFPFILTVWDLCHRDCVEFPEVRQDRVFEHREQRYSRTLSKAVAIFVDSELGRDNAIRRYGLDFGRVIVYPFSPAPSVSENATAELGEPDTRAKYAIDGPYVFYPAQFWSHKNHVYLLRGLARLEREFGHSVHAVFTGSDKGNIDNVRRAAERLGIARRVHFAGFVANDEIPRLYRAALALVMPTYFGPTNLPPLEAFRIGTPVLYSDLDGMRDQVGDAALLMDLSDPASLARHLNDLISDSGLRQRLISRGRARLRQLESFDGAACLAGVLSGFRDKMLSWSFTRE